MAWRGVTMVALIVVHSRGLHSFICARLREKVAYRSQMRHTKPDSQHSIAERAHSRNLRAK